MVMVFSRALDARRRQRPENAKAQCHVREPGGADEVDPSMAGSPTQHVEGAPIRHQGRSPPTARGTGGPVHTAQGVSERPAPEQLSACDPRGERLPANRDGRICLVPRSGPRIQMTNNRMRRRSSNPPPLPAGHAGDVPELRPVPLPALPSHHVRSFSLPTTRFATGVTAGGRGQLPPPAAAATAALGIA